MKASWAFLFLSQYPAGIYGYPLGILRIFIKFFFIFPRKKVHQRTDKKKGGERGGERSGHLLRSDSSLAVQGLTSNLPSLVGASVALQLVSSGKEIRLNAHPEIPPPVQDCYGALPNRFMPRQLCIPL